MATLRTVVLECPQCGAPVRQGSNVCGRCYSEYMVTSTNSLEKFDDLGIKKYLKVYESNLKAEGESAELYTAMGICQLKRKLYKYASNYFDKAIALLPEDGNTYYYAAIAILNGKRPFLSQLSVIRKAIEYIQLASEFSEQGTYYFLHYLIHKDYYERKQLGCSPSSSELLQQAKLRGLVEADAQEVSRMVGLN